MKKKSQRVLEEPNLLSSGTKIHAITLGTGLREHTKVTEKNSNQGTASIKRKS